MCVQSGCRVGFMVNNTLIQHRHLRGKAMVHLRSLQPCTAAVYCFINLKIDSKAPKSYTSSILLQKFHNTGGFRLEFAVLCTLTGPGPGNSLGPYLIDLSTFVCLHTTPNCTCQLTVYCQSPKTVSCGCCFNCTGRSRWPDINAPCIRLFNCVVQ
jgi:hypothetical protein